MLTNENSKLGLDIPKIIDNMYVRNTAFIYDAFKTIMIPQNMIGKIAENYINVFNTTSEDKEYYVAKELEKILFIQLDAECPAKRNKVTHSVLHEMDDLPENWKPVVFQDNAVFGDDECFAFYKGPDAAAHIFGIKYAHELNDGDIEVCWISIYDWQYVRRYVL